MLTTEEILKNMEGIKDTEDTRNKADNSTLDVRILRMKKGCSYHGRFVPYVKNTAGKNNTFVSYDEVTFNSRADGSIVYMGRSPSDPEVKVTPDIIKKTQWDAYSAAKTAGDKPAMDLACKLIPQRKQFVNFYLTEVEGDDAGSKAKVGTVVAVRYPAALDKEKNPKSVAYKNIYDGLMGAFKKKIGDKGYVHPKHLKDGVNFVFRVIDKGGYPNYDQSNFDVMGDPSPELTKEQCIKIIEDAHDLTLFAPALKSKDEQQELLDLHWFCKSASN